jgi:hypothetical protein
MPSEVMIKTWTGYLRRISKINPKPSAKTYAGQESSRPSPARLKTATPTAMATAYPSRPSIIAGDFHHGPGDKRMAALVAIHSL